VVDWLRNRLGEIPAISEVWGPWHLCRTAQKPSSSEVPSTFVPPTLLETGTSSKKTEPPTAPVADEVLYFDEILSDPLDRLPTKFNLESWKRSFDRARTSRAK
jgi:hypothetical protein